MSSCRSAQPTVRAQRGPMINSTKTRHPILCSVPIGHGVWVPAYAGTTLSVRRARPSPTPLWIQISYSQAPSPVFFAAPGTPSSNLRPLEGAERRETRRLATPPGRLAKPPDTPGEARRLRGDERRASRRSTAAIFVLGSALPGTRAYRPVPVQQAPCGGVVVPPDRVPGLPVPRLRAAAAGAAPAPSTERLRKTPSVSRVK